MSNGYGYKTQVSPANAGPYQGYGYGGYGTYPMGGQQPTTLPAGMMGQQPTTFPGGMLGQQPTTFPGGMMGQQPTTLPAGMQVQSAQMQQLPPAVPSGSFVTPTGGNIVTLPAVEESYVENILRLNRGKMATFYMTYENNREWNAKIFKGIIEAAGRDHIVISDPTTGMRYLLLTLNLDYVTFDEPIAYEYPFQGSVVSPSTPMGTATIGTAPSSR